MQIQSFKEILPHWELADSFSVVEAAALISGFEPTSIDDSLEWFRNKETGFTDGDGINEFIAMLNILLRAVRSQSLKASDHASHLKVISIERVDLVEWMLNKGGRFRPAFFFPGEQDSGEYASAADRQRLRQLEAENARLAEQVAQLQLQLQEATAAPQQAPQEEGPAPQQATAAPQDDEKPLHQKERKTFLNIVGAMLDLLVPATSETLLIETLEDAYGHSGLKARTLQKKFAEAKRSINPG